MEHRTTPTPLWKTCSANWVSIYWMIFMTRSDMTMDTKIYDPATPLGRYLNHLNKTQDTNCRMLFRDPQFTPREIRFTSHAQLDKWHQDNSPTLTVEEVVFFYIHSADRLMHYSKPSIVLINMRKLHETLWLWTKWKIQNQMNRNVQWVWSPCTVKI